MLSQRVKQWGKAYVEQGLEQGIGLGEALVLKRQLARRFGPLPDALLQRIDSAPREHLELWLDRILEAASLDEVFADAG